MTLFYNFFFFFLLGVFLCIKSQMNKRACFYSRKCHVVFFFHCNQSITTPVICGFPKLLSNNMDYGLTSKWLARCYVIRTAECYYGAWRCGLRQLRQLFSQTLYQPLFFSPNRQKHQNSVLCQRGVILA